MANRIREAHALAERVALKHNIQLETVITTFKIALAQDKCGVPFEAVCENVCHILKKATCSHPVRNALY